MLRAGANGNPHLLVYTSCVGTYVSSGVIVNNVCGGPYALSLTFDVQPGTHLHNLVMNTTADFNFMHGGQMGPAPVGDLTAAISTFSFTDGTGFSITQADATQPGFQSVFDVTTGNNGNILAWFIYAAVFPPSGTGAFYEALTAHGLGLGSVLDGSLLESYDASAAGTEVNGNFHEVGGGLTNSTDFPGVLSTPAQWTVMRTPVPEPSSLLLLGTGLLALVGMGWRRKQIG